VIEVWNVESDRADQELNSVEVVLKWSRNREHKYYPIDSSQELLSRYK